MMRVVFLDGGRIEQRILDESGVEAFVAALESRGSMVLRVKREGQIRFKLAGRQKLEAWVPWFSALARTLNGGVPLQAALEVLLEAAPDQEAMRMVHADILSGRRFSESVAVRLPQLPRLLPALLQAGESAGDLSKGAALCRRTLEDWVGLKRELVARLSYPLVVVCSASIAMIVLLSKVFPAMRGMWENLGKPVPPRLLAIQVFGWIGVATLAALGFGLAWVMKGEESSARVPGFGTLGRHRQRSELWSALAMALTGGVQLAEALALLGKRWGADETLRSISTGTKPEQALSKWVDDAPGQRAVLVASLRVGDLPGGAEAVAEGYRDLLAQDLQKLQRRLEPAVLVLLGCILMGMAWGLFAVMGEMEHGLV